MWKVYLYVEEELVEEVNLDFVPFRGLNMSFGDFGLYIEKVGYHNEHKDFTCFCSILK